MPQACGESVAVASDSETPDLLSVLKLYPKTGFEEFYKGQLPLDLSGPPHRNTS